MVVLIKYIRYNHLCPSKIWLTLNVNAIIWLLIDIYCYHIVNKIVVVIVTRYLVFLFYQGSMGVISCQEIYSNIDDENHVWWNCDYHYLILRDKFLKNKKGILPTKIFLPRSRKLGPQNNNKSLSLKQLCSKWSTPLK